MTLHCDSQHNTTPMKIVLEIHDDHAPAMLELLATLAARKTKRCEALAKFLSGEDDEAATEQEDQAYAGGADWSPMNPPEPLTASPELPMPELIPNLPTLPDGKSRWVYLGTFPETDIETAKAIQFPTREIRWFSENKWEWIPCWSLNGQFHHIEAI